MGKFPLFCPRDNFKALLMVNLSIHPALSTYEMVYIKLESFTFIPFQVLFYQIQCEESGGLVETKGWSWTWLRNKMKLNSLQLMQKFHKTRKVFEEIAHCSSNNAHVQEGDRSFVTQ